MNKFYIKIFLKSGNIIKGTYEGNEENTDLVAENLFIGDINRVMGIKSLTGGNLFFILKNVEAFEIDIKEIN